MNTKTKLFFNRCLCVITGKKGIYGKIQGEKNHFSKGVIVYEEAIIGSYNYFAPYTLVRNAYIGNYCSIGPGCKIGLGEHDMTAIAMRPIVGNGNETMSLINEEKPSKLGNDVWLGANVVIRQGCFVGNGAVIGANAVVTENIPAYAIAVGVPARVIRFRFNSEVSNKIDESKWYEKGLNEAKKTVRALRESLED